MDRNDLPEQIQNARALGQKLEGLVVNAGKITIKTEASRFLIGFWSLICDYDKGLLNLLHWKFYGAAFALWRPFVEATVRAHLLLMLPPDDLDKLKREKYRVNFKTVPAEIDQAFGLGKLFENFLPERVRVALHSYTHSGGRSREGSNRRRECDAWLLGLEFDSPSGIFWEIENPPADWWI